jgi:ribosomal protein L11 methyltransferase
MDPRSDYQPFLVGSRLRIVPPGTTAGTCARLDLVVARGAFGSGEHETTSSCLEVLESLPGLERATVLDFGAGTGILAIAALRLGAGRAVLVDNDPAAIEAAREHLRLNAVADRAELVEGELGSLRGRRFDLILANLHGDLLLRFGHELVALAAPGGRLILSGILWELGWDVRELFTRLGCELLLDRFLSEYCTLLLRHA